MVKRKAAKKTAAKKKPQTFKSLKSAGRALKAKGKKKLDRNTPAAKGEAEKRIDVAKLLKVPVVTPKGYPTRPINTRWPKEIIVGKRHRKDFGDLGQLAHSFDERGTIIQPIAITEDNKLIAGERRLRAWPKSKFSADPIPVHVITIDAIVAGEWDENAHRKDFTPEEAVSIKREIETLLKKHAKDRQRTHGGSAPGRKGAAAPEFRASERAAAMTGKKRRTLEKAEKLIKAREDNPNDKRIGKLVDDMNRTGKVDGPFKRLMIMQQSEALRKAPPPLPMRGPYHAIVVDFPWPAEKDADQADIDKRGRAMRDYPEMSIEEGCKLFRSKEFQALLAPDVRVYFCTTNHHMDAAFVLLKAMGFENHSTIGTWGKNKHGRGAVLFGKTEHCILAERGKPVTSNLDADGKVLTTDWSGPGWEVREDSRKPKAFYDLVEQNTPAPRYAEIFSRGGLNEKWDCHGDQAGKFSPAVTIEQQAAIMAPVTKTPDELKLMALEAIERGGAPDTRLFDKKLIEQLDKLADGKKTLKLNSAGRRALSDLREDAADAAVLRSLPVDRASLADQYRQTLAERHDAIIAKELDRTAELGRRIILIANKYEKPDALKVDHSYLGSWLQRFHDLNASMAAAPGAVPMWGQPGIFAMDIDGIGVVVHTEGTGDFTIYPAVGTALFTSAERPEYSGLELYDDLQFSSNDLKSLMGRSVDQYVTAEFRDSIKHHTPPKKGPPRKGFQPLVAPKKVYAVPALWDGKSDLKPVKPGKAANARKELPAKAKTVGRTLPGRDADLIEFAETHGHVVSMTNDAEHHIASCACSSLMRWQYPFNRAGLKQIDAVVTAHWIEQRNLKTTQPTADALPVGQKAGDGLDIPAFLKRETVKPAAEAAE
jgi:N6-adenosine-specific RNA methylase IME4